MVTGDQHKLPVTEKKWTSPPIIWPFPGEKCSVNSTTRGSIFDRQGGRFLDPPFLSANFFEKVKSLCGTRKWKIPKNNGKRFDPFFRPFLVKIHFFKKSGLFRPGDFTKSDRRPGGGSTGREKVGSTREIGRADPPLSPQKSILERNPGRRGVRFWPPGGSFFGPPVFIRKFFWKIAGQCKYQDFHFFWKMAIFCG